MADIQEKEELNTQEQVASENNAPEQEQENVEDYFNPFADISKEDKKIEEEIEEEEGEDEDKEKENKPTSSPVEEDVKNELAEVRAERKASKEVNSFVKEHPEFSDMTDELIDLASKATVRGHSKPLEFAIRNVKSPTYWIEQGKKMAREDLSEVSRNKVGGSSLSKGENKGATDYMNVNKDDFETLVRSVKNGA